MLVGDTHDSMQNHGLQHVLLLKFHVLLHKPCSYAEGCAACQGRPSRVNQMRGVRIELTTLGL